VFTILPKINRAESRARPAVSARFLRTSGPLLVVVFILLSSRSALAVEPAPRETVLFNVGWRFQSGDPNGPHDSLDYAHLRSWLLPSGDACLSANAGHHRPDGNLGQDVPYTQNEFDDSSWRPVDLPHDWAIEGPFVQDFPSATGKLRYWGPAWYRKHFLLEPGDEGRLILLQIDGAMSYAAVWLNGRFVGGWPYGYTSFQLDLTPFVRIGADKVLAIRLNTPPDVSRWYPGAGLYRNVWLLKTSPIHISPWGVQITTFDAAAALATAHVKVTVQQRLGCNADLQSPHPVICTGHAKPSRSRRIRAGPGDRRSWTARGRGNVVARTAPSALEHPGPAALSRRNHH